MKFNLLTMGFITNVFFTYIPVSAMLATRGSRDLVREKKETLANNQKLTNKWVTLVSRIPAENKFQHIDLLRILEWDAYYYKKEDLKVYEDALINLKQQKINFSAPLGERAIPALSSTFNLSNIENIELKNKISPIIEEIRASKIKNFNVKIDNYTKKIKKNLDIIKEKPHLELAAQERINTDIASQLEQIQQKTNFTQDKNELQQDIEKLKSYKDRITGKNLILFEQLKKRTEEPDMGLPVTEPQSEEQPASSPSTQDLSQQGIEPSEGSIIPYQPFSLEQLLKTFEAKNTKIMGQDEISGSSTSSPISPVSTPPNSPRKSEVTEKPAELLSPITTHIPQKHLSSLENSSIASPVPTPLSSRRKEEITPEIRTSEIDEQELFQVPESPSQAQAEEYVNLLEQKTTTQAIQQEDTKIDLTDTAIPAGKPQESEPTKQPDEFKSFIRKKPHQSNLPEQTVIPKPKSGIISSWWNKFTSFFSWLTDIIERLYPQN